MTVAREAREELGEAAQFFHASPDALWYKMTATFFAAELDGEPAGGEHELDWIDDRAGETFFHACHAWAVSLVRMEGRSA